MTRSMLVRDYMIASPLTFTSDMDLLQAAHQLIRSGFSGAPVVDEQGWPVGMLTEQDCIASALQAYYHGTRGGLVGEHMTPKPRTVGADDSIFDAAQQFMNQKYYGYPVVTDDGYLVGLLRRRDVLKAMGEFYPK